MNRLQDKWYFFGGRGRQQKREDEAARYVPDNQSRRDREMDLLCGKIDDLEMKLVPTLFWENTL